MSFFRKNTISIKKQQGNKGVDFYIDYHKVEKLVEFKKNLLKEMIQDGTCLAVVDTNMMYNKNQPVDEGIADRLLEQLKNLEIEYEKISTKNTQSAVVFGVPIKMGEKDKRKDHRIGFVLNSDKMNEAGSIMEKYNIHYYFEKEKKDTESLLDIFRSKHDDEEELSDAFQYHMFDNILIQHMAIYASKEDSAFLENVIQKIKERL